MLEKAYNSIITITQSFLRMNKLVALILPLKVHGNKIEAKEKSKYIFFSGRTNLWHWYYPTKEIKGLKHYKIKKFSIKE